MDRKRVAVCTALCAAFASSLAEGLGLEHNLWLLGSAPSLRYSAPASTRHIPFLTGYSSNRPA